VVRANVGHDLSARQDLGMKLIFELVELLVAISLVLRLSGLETCPLVVVHLHGEGRLL
jgi:hypothetical protein